MSTSVTSQRRASSSTAAQYAFHLRWGSIATPTMTSRARPGDCAIENSVAGQTSSRSVSEPARNRTVGRESPKW